jgi:hypothetical protein
VILRELARLAAPTSAAVITEAGSADTFGTQFNSLGTPFYYSSPPSAPAAKTRWSERGEEGRGGAWKPIDHKLMRPKNLPDRVVGLGHLSPATTAIGFRQQPVVGQRVVLASDVAVFVLQATLENNGATNTGDTKDGVMSPSGRPKTLLDLFMGSMIGRIVALPGLAALSQQRARGKGLPRVHGALLSTGDIPVSHEEAGRGVFDVWQRGRQFVTATVSWDGDLGGQVFSPSGTGPGGQTWEEEGRAGQARRVRSGYLVGKNGRYHLLSLPPALSAAESVYADWKGHQGTVVERLARVRLTSRRTLHRPTRLALFRKAVADIVYGDSHWQP